MHYWIVIGVGVLIVALLVAAMDAAYYNGVSDGFGYALDPSCPGYQRAGRYLHKHMRFRWIELQNPEYRSYGSHEDSKGDSK